MSLLIRYQDPIGPTVPPCWSDGYRFSGHIVSQSGPEVGARYMEAIRGARAMRQRAARSYDHPTLGGAFPFEREYGTLWFGGSWPR